MVMEQTLPSWHSQSLGYIPRELLISLLGSPGIVGERPRQHIMASPDLESGLLSFLQTHSLILDSELAVGTPH